MQAASPANAAATASTSPTRLSYLPVGLFGAVMGLAGLAQAWRLAQQHFGAPGWIAAGIGGLALLVFVALTIAYGIKAVSGFGAVRAEFAHPIAGNLFGAPLISLLLLPLPLAGLSLPLARLSWVLGTAGMIVFAWTILTRWLSVRHASAQVAPSWIVPVVGLLDIPLAVPALRWEGLHGVMMFGLAVGLFFALPLLSLQPSLLILLAPFAVGFSAYVTTFGRIDAFAEGLLMITLFLLPVLLGRLVHLPACSPFRVSWWAASFPLAAAASATLRYAAFAASPPMDAIALLVLALATLAIGLFALQTVAGIARGRLQALS